MLGIVHKVLWSLQNEGMVNDQCFYVSFNTTSLNVIMSERLKQRYPEEITIVLQYQFRDLIVFDNKFTVNMSFDGIPETIEVPFDSLTGFVDVNANFSLKFSRIAENAPSVVDEFAGRANISKLKKHPSPSVLKVTPVKSTKEPKKKTAASVIQLDQFRKKHSDK